MNRQLRRANEKSDKRREKEQEKRKTARRAVRSFPTKPSPRTDTRTDKAARPTPGTRWPWLTGAYLLLVVGVIAMQAVVPQQTDPFSLVIHGLFYVILGYFLCLWLLRRGVKGALIAATVGGILLAVGVEAVKLLRPEGAPPNLLFVYLAVPGLLVGTWLGRFIHQRTA